MDQEPRFPILDEPTERRQSYYLPPDELRRVAAMAAHLSNLDAISPLGRRLATWGKEQERERMAQGSTVGADRGRTGALEAGRKGS